MKRAIWKVAIKTVPGKSTVVLPLDAKMLTARYQNSAFGRGLFLWADVDPDDNTLADHTIHVFATGEPFDDHSPLYGGTLHYLATVEDGAGLIWHVYHE